MKKVAITGVGVLSPYGEGARKVITAILQGKVKERIETPIPKVPLKSKNKRLRLDRISKMALYGAWAALNQSSYDYEDNGDTIGISLGTNTGGLDQSMTLVSKLFENELDFAAPMIFPNTVKNASANQIAIALSIYGTNITFAGGGIDPSIVGVKEGVILVGAGKERVMLAGGLEEIVEKEAEAQKMLEPAFRPIGEGAYILCLETLDDSLKRGADILAELAIIETSYKKEVALSGMEALYTTALKKTGLSPDEIDLTIFYGRESGEAASSILPFSRALSTGTSLALPGVIGAGAIAVGAYAIRYGIGACKPKNVAIAKSVGEGQSAVILKSVLR